DSQEAIDQLERLRVTGAEFLLFPSPAFWWLNQYEGLARHLEARYQKIADNQNCIVYELAPGSASLGQLERQLEQLTDYEQQIRQVVGDSSPGSLHPFNGAKRGATVGASMQGNYRQLVARIRAIVQSVVPPNAHVIVVSKGDTELLELHGHTTAH